MMGLDVLQAVWILVSAVLGIWAFSLIVAALVTNEEEKSQRRLLIAMALIVYFVSLVILRNC